MVRQLGHALPIVLLLAVHPLHPQPTSAQQPAHIQIPDYSVLRRLTRPAALPCRPEQPFGFKYLIELTQVVEPHFRSRSSAQRPDPFFILTEISQRSVSDPSL